MKPKPFWVLKNFTVPTGIVVPFTLLVERPSRSALGRQHSEFLGDHLSRSPNTAACQQDEAENHVAGGGIDGFRRWSTPCTLCAIRAARMHHIALYKLVMADAYSWPRLGTNLN